MKDVILKITLSMTVVLACAGFSAAIYGYNEPVVTQNAIGIVIDGAAVGDDTAARIENARVLIPLRAVVEYLGGKVLWYPQEQQIIGFRGARGFDLVIGSDRAFLSDGATYTLDVPAKIVDGRTYVPLRFVSEAMGCTVTWDDTDRIVSISTKPTNTAAEVLALAKPALVRVQTERREGSGFFFSKDGRIITCADVVKDATEIRVKLSDGEEYAAEVLTVDSVLNLARLRVKLSDGRTPAVFRYFDDFGGMEVGDRVYVAGAATMTDGTLKSGRISEKIPADDSGGNMAAYHVTALIEQGDHGGPVLKDNGALLGVSCRPSVDVRAVPYVIPIEYAFQMKQR